MRTRTLLLVLLAVLLLIALGAAYTGFVTFHQDSQGVVVGDAAPLALNASELTTCCTFRQDGTERRCAVLPGYDCGYCKEYC